ncbi:MAG: hypothetical protein IKL68_00555 [Clostridia bacterium]|nr:hypothetical protein [Clostridia bacterium]
MRKNSKGVSLIVLSITILVMAILAATAIIALEDSGIIGRSKNTASKQNYIQEYERLQVIKNGLLTDNLGKITIDEYITELTNKGLVESGVTTNPDGSKSVTTKTGFIANIIQDGESNLIISLGTSNATITLSTTTLSGDITSGSVTKTITATTKNVTGDIIWTSSNSSVASVTGTNTSATVTMKNVGTATITATYGNAKASCTVVVTENTLVTYEVSGTWVFNEILDSSGYDDGGLGTEISFVSNGTSYSSLSFYIDSMCTVLLYDYDQAWSESLTMANYGEQVWESNSYRTVDFGSTPQAVSEEFYNWFVANAEEYTPNLITFTIGEYSFQAEEGMTWEQWINSKYNQTIIMENGDTVEMCIKSDNVYFIQNDKANGIIGEFLVAYDRNTTYPLELTDTIQAIEYYC